MWRICSKQMVGTAAFELQESQLRALLDQPWDHVLPSHGNPVIGGAKEKYSKALTNAEFTTPMRVMITIFDIKSGGPLRKKCGLFLGLAVVVAVAAVAIRWRST